MNTIKRETLLADANYIEEFILAMYWMPTKQAHDFDEWLRIPIRNRTDFQNLVGEFFNFRRSLNPDARYQVVLDKFDTLLFDLERKGENVERLLLWFLTLAEGDESLGMRPLATGLWINTLRDWAQKETIESRCDSLGVNKSIASSYRKRVYQVRKEFIELQKIAKTWRKNSTEYSEFDGLVFSIYFSTLTRGHPASFFEIEIERSLHREWWRSVRDLFTDDQVAGLHNEMLLTLATSAEPELADWDNAIPIDEAFTIDLLPPFDSVARDW